MRTGWMKACFVLSALYDLVLGAAFLLFHRQVFAFFHEAPPGHPAYVQFPGLLLILFAALYLRIAADPVRHRDLIPFGAGLKAAYAGVVLTYAATSGIPAMWLPWAWADLGFLAAFMGAWWRLQRGVVAQGAASEENLTPSA